MPDAASAGWPAPARHHAVTRALHWTMAVVLAAQVALGWWMQSLPKAPPGPRAEWFNVHKSIGITLGLLWLLRLAWMARRPPVPTWALPAWQQWAARLNHGLLLLAMGVLPLSGLLGSGFSPYPVRWFGLSLPRWSAPWPEAKAWCSQVHEAAVFVFLATLALHLVAVAWHALWLRDGVLTSMGPRRRSGHPG